MASKEWVGGAAAAAMVRTFAFSGTWEATDLIVATFANGKAVTVTAGSTVTNTVIDNFVTAWNALDSALYPEFAEITASRSSSNLVLTADTEGVPFEVTLSMFDTGLTAADDQRIEGATSPTTGTIGTTSDGPNDWSVDANWSPSGVPIDDDDISVTRPNAPAILYGLDQSAITPDSLTIRAHRNAIGLPEQNAAGYPEYRLRFLTISPDVFTIDCPSGRVQLDTGTVATVGHVLATGAPSDRNGGAFIWKGDEATNELNVVAGNVAIAPGAGEVGTLATLRVTGATASETTLAAGDGAAIDTYEQTGGTVTLGTCPNNVLLNGGTLTVMEGDSTAIIADAGTLYYRGAGTLTDVKAGSDATFDLSRDMRPCTITDAELNAGCSWLDPHRRATHTNPRVLNRCGIADIKKFDLGTHVTLDVAAGP